MNKWAISIIAITHDGKYSRPTWEGNFNRFILEEKTVLSTVRSFQQYLHRALCSLFQPDTDGRRVSKCGQQTRRLDPILFQCRSSAVGGGPILKQHWVKSWRLLGSTQVSVYTHPSPTIIFSPVDQGTFSKTAGQSQAYYNTWNWEQGTYDVNHLQILTCEVAVSTVGSVNNIMKI